MTRQAAETIAIIRQNVQPLDPQPTGASPQLARLPGIRAVLFDVYGTMLISGCGEVGTLAVSGRERAVAQAFEASGVSLACEPSWVVETLVATIGDHQEASRRRGVEYPEVDIVHVWSDVLTALTDETSVSERELANVEPLRIAVDYEVRANLVWPMPYLEECLAQLCRSNRLLGVISNAQVFTPMLFPALLDRSLTELGFDEAMSFYSYEHGAAKPGKKLFDLACQKLSRRGIAADETIYVGNDMLNDIQAAVGVGMRTALFAGDARSLRLREDDPRTRGVQPDIVLTDLAQLPGCLGPSPEETAT